ncbi:PREDICTED: nucleoside diphosphate kinase II, chloroplastic-like [Tarenaya hassleriana]|uniref:nucleoside diphosphate kinase II, chloroplastic-like n=1 Tax=Tarenaya hassleriana TaxID=28532 RepID=UPI00053C1649|nr:PREDICTED: nucleoside diphosphate kinase II, chloroplastic-like [Tarenaya hassleriana]
MDKRLRRHLLFLPPLAFFPTFVASMEQTYIMVKPDGVQRGLVGEVISRFERKGFKITGLKLIQCPRELAEEHYRDLKAKPYFPKLIQFITSGPVVCMAWEGVGVVASGCKLKGRTSHLQAEPGTIRGDLAAQTQGLEMDCDAVDGSRSHSLCRNIVHGSDSPQDAKREIALWFKQGELCEWEQAQASWLRE